MKSKDKGNKATTIRLATALLVAMCAVFLWQPASLKVNANQLGSHGGGAVGGDTGGEEAGEVAGEGAGEAEGQEGGADGEVDQIISENQEGVNPSSVASVTIIPNSARVRSEASVNSSVAGSLSKGDIVPVVGQTTGSDGKVWYQIATEKDGKAINGYVREDLVDPVEMTQPSEAPEENPAEPQQPETQAPNTSQDYYVEYADDGTGVSDWYLNDTANGTRYKVSELLNAQKTNASNAELMESETSKLRIIIIVLAVVIVLLVIVVTVMILKLKNSYDDDYAVDDDDEDDDYGEDDDEDEEDEPDEDDEDDEEDDEDEDDYVPRRKKRKPLGRKKPSRKKPSRKRRYEDDDDDEDEDEEDYYGDEEEDEDEEDDDMMYDGEVSYQESRRSSGSKKKTSSKSQPKSKKDGWQSKNFLDTDDDDDLDFEFLDLK